MVRELAAQSGEGVRPYRLRQQGITDLDRRQVESLTINLKTHRQLKRFSINNQTFIVLTKQYLALQRIDR